MPDTLELEAVRFTFDKITVHVASNLRHLEASLARDVLLRSSFLKFPAMQLQQSGVPITPEVARHLQQLAFRTVRLDARRVTVRFDTGDAAGEVRPVALQETRFNFAAAQAGNEHGYVITTVQHTADDAFP